MKSLESFEIPILKYTVTHFKIHQNGSRTAQYVTQFLSHNIISQVIEKNEFFLTRESIGLLNLSTPEYKKKKNRGKN